MVTGWVPGTGFFESFFVCTGLNYKTTGHILNDMSKSEAKKDLILDRGLQVMMSRGYNGTSVKDIVDAAGVPKGSFYNYFESKESFALDAIERVASENLKEMQRMLDSRIKSPKLRIEEFFKANIYSCCEKKFRIGCFLGNMSQEMSDNSEAIRRMLHVVMDRTTSLLTAALTQMQSDGDLSEAYDPEGLAEFLISAWQGAMMRMKTDSCQQPLDVFLAHLNLIFDAQHIRTAN
tara:strand:+ start:257 stop:958 length:702 start_codon:yes stop_codon:yes gene_type:complete